MSAPLVFSTATKGAPAEVSTSVPKGSPVDSRLGSTDFAALLSAGVAAAADEKRPPLGGATVSLGQAAALAAGAPSPVPGRGQRRNDDRDRGGPQHAVVPTPAAAVPPAGVLPPTWLHDGERPMDASEPSAWSPGLQPGGESFGGERQAGTDTPAPATAGAPALEAPPVRTQARAPAREAAVSLAGLGVPTITAARARPLVLPVNVPVPVPEIAAERALPESGQSIASLPSGTSTGTGTRTGETNTRLRPSSLASPIPTPTTTTATTAIPIVIETPTATPTAFTSRRVPGEAFAPAFPAAALSPRSAAAAPISQVRMPIPHASAAAAVESPGAEDRVVAAPESPAPVGVLALPVVTPTAAPHAGAGRIDVMAIDQPLVPVAPPLATAAVSVGVIAPAPPVVAAASKAQARGANADSTAIAPPPVSVVSRSQGRVASVDAVPTKAPIGLAPPSAPQPAAPAGTHFAGPGKPAPVDHASASVDGPSAPPAAARPKLDEVTPVSADSVQQPDTQPQALLEVAPVDAASPAKTLTVVTKASPTAAVPSAAVGARLRDALVSVANHAVLRGEATGQIDVPELGRVAVRAHSAGGTVNVEVTAEAPEARAMLRGHVGAMTADLHAADVPVGRLTVDRAGASSGNSLGSSMSSRDRGASTGGESARDNRPQSDGDSAPAVVEAITPRRVRIVL